MYYLSNLFWSVSTVLKWADRKGKAVHLQYAKHKLQHMLSLALLKHQTTRDYAVRTLGRLKFTIYTALDKVINILTANALL